VIAIAATSNATPSLQSVLNRARLEQARRDAEQAEANARNLRAQVTEEERKAQQGQDKVRTLTAQAQQDDDTYTSALKLGGSTLPAINRQPPSTGRVLNIAA
jgi:hypothetical protein